MLMQEVWIHGLVKLSQELSSKVTKWFTELSILSDIRVPGCLQVRKEVKSATLLTFVDASQGGCMLSTRLTTVARSAMFGGKFCATAVLNALSDKQTCLPSSLLVFIVQNLSNTPSL